MIVVCPVFGCDAYWTGLDIGHLRALERAHWSSYHEPYDPPEEEEDE